jgi:hypothetical protein
MSKLSHYKVALYLSATIALAEVFWILFYVIPRIPQFAKEFTITLTATVITILGLLVQSSFIRYIGAGFMVFWALALFWGVYFGGTAALFRPTSAVISLYYFFSGALNLLTAAILFFSKQFANEFAERRNRQPKYMINLIRVLIGAVVVAMFVATAYDILNLTSAP